MEALSVVQINFVLNQVFVFLKSVESFPFYLNCIVTDIMVMGLGQLSWNQTLDQILEQVGPHSAFDLLSVTLRGGSRAK